MQVYTQAAPMTFSFAAHSKSGAAPMPILPTRSDEAPTPTPEHVAHLLRALMKIESSGDANAVAPSGKYFGLFQMGHDRAADVGIPDARAFLGNPQLAAWATVASLKRSARTHRWAPDRVAVSWKAGTGSLKKVLRAMESGQTFDQAVATQIPTSWNTGEYVRRFRNAWETT